MIVPQNVPLRNVQMHPVVRVDLVEGGADVIDHLPDPVLCEGGSRDVPWRQNCN
jgi:hypothetical protein